MLRTVAAMLCLLLLAACSGVDTAADDVPGLDFAASDPGVEGVAPDAAIRPDATDDAGPDAFDAAPVDSVPPANQPPGFDALAPLTLKMGHVATLDLNAALDDAEDPDAALVVSWSTQHVALADDGSHVLVVVAPIDWFGDEVVELVVTDTAGASASAFLAVTVEEVTPPEPATGCPKALFSYAAADNVAEVLLSGTMNDWAGVGASTLKLADPDGDHTWQLEVALAEGHYLYKFIVDGTWLADPSNPDTVDDGYGGVNSVLDVPACEEE